MKRLASLVVAVILSGCGENGGDTAQNRPTDRMHHDLAKVSGELKQQPNSPLLYFEIGQIYERYGLIDSALASYDHSVLLHEAFPEAHQRRGDLHFQKQNLELSAAAYEQAARFAPNAPQVHNNLGFVYRRQNRLDEAIGAYERALALDSLMVEAINNLGQVYRESGDISSAIRSFRRAISVDADFRQAYVNLTKMLAEEGEQTQEERDLLEQMVSRFDPSREADYARSRLAELDGE